MRFKVPVDLKERRRYVCIKHPDGYQLASRIRETMMRIGGIKCLSHTKLSVVSMGKGSIVMTSERSIPALLTALLILKYLDCSEIEVMGVSGNIRKAKELCERWK